MEILEKQTVYIEAKASPCSLASRRPCDVPNIPGPLFLLLGADSHLLD